MIFPALAAAIDLGSRGWCQGGGQAPFFERSRSSQVVAPVRYVSAHQSTTPVRHGALQTARSKSKLIYSCGMLRGGGCDVSSGALLAQTDRQLRPDRGRQRTDRSVGPPTHSLCLHSGTFDVCDSQIFLRVFVVHGPPRLRRRPSFVLLAQRPASQGGRQKQQAAVERAAVLLSRIRARSASVCPHSRPLAPMRNFLVVHQEAVSLCSGDPTCSSIHVYCASQHRRERW